MIRVNQQLTKTREPVEYNLKISGEQGKIIQQLPDGYNLVLFDHLKFKKRIRFSYGKMVSLKWYVHFDDIDFFNR